MSWYGVPSQSLEAGKTMRSILPPSADGGEAAFARTKLAVDKTTFEYPYRRDCGIVLVRDKSLWTECKT